MKINELTVNQKDLTKVIQQALRANRFYLPNYVNENIADAVIGKLEEMQEDKSNTAKIG